MTVLYDIQDCISSPKCVGVEPFLILPQPCSASLVSNRPNLDDASFQAAWAEGHCMTLEQAIAEALDE